MATVWWYWELAPTAYMFLSNEQQNQFVQGINEYQNSVVSGYSL
jgi:hypothetical protein